MLPGTDRLFDQIKDGDMVIIVTSRSVQYRELTEKFLSDNHIRYDSIIYEAPYGERILINDRKPSGRDMAFAFNIDRDIACAFEIRENESL